KINEILKIQEIESTNVKKPEETQEEPKSGVQEQDVMEPSAAEREGNLSVSMEIDEQSMNESEELDYEEEPKDKVETTQNQMQFVKELGYQSMEIDESILMDERNISHEENDEEETPK